MEMITSVDSCWERGSRQPVSQCPSSELTQHSTPIGTYCTDSGNEQTQLIRLVRDADNGNDHAPQNSHSHEGKDQRSLPVLHPFLS